MNLNTFFARAACEYDAICIAGALRKNPKNTNVQLHQLPGLMSSTGEVLEYEDTLTWESENDSVEALRELIVAVREFPDAHLLVGTFAHEDAYTGEVIEMNYFNYDLI